MSMYAEVRPARTSKSRLKQMVLCAYWHTLLRKNHRSRSWPIVCHHPLVERFQSAHSSVFFVGDMKLFDKVLAIASFIAVRRFAWVVLCYLLSTEWGVVVVWRQESAWSRGSWWMRASASRQTHCRQYSDVTPAIAVNYYENSLQAFPPTASSLGPWVLRNLTQAI